MSWRVKSPMGDWQESGKIRLAGMAFDMIELVHAALPLVKKKRCKSEIEAYLSGGKYPSQEALEALEAAIIQYVASLSKDTP